MRWKPAEDPAKKTMPFQLLDFGEQQLGMWALPDKRNKFITSIYDSYEWRLGSEAGEKVAEIYKMNSEARLDYKGACYNMSFDWRRKMQLFTKGWDSMEPTQLTDENGVETAEIDPYGSNILRALRLRGERITPAHGLPLELVALAGLHYHHLNNRWASPKGSTRP